MIPLTRRFLILGAAGSGKSYFARRLRLRWPYSVYVDTQHQIMENVIVADIPGPAFWKLLTEKRHVGIRLSNSNSLEGWYIQFLVYLSKLRAQGFTADVLLVAEESGYYGLSHYASHVQVFDDIILRSRIKHSTAIILHDLHQVPSTLLNAGVTDIIHFRPGPSQKAAKYLEERYPALGVEVAKVAAKPYSYAHYDVISQKARFCEAVK